MRQRADYRHPNPGVGWSFYAEDTAATAHPLPIVGLILGRSSKAYAKISRAFFEIVAGVE
jgi:hypothetical protein